MPDLNPLPSFSFGRLASWLVLALMGASVLYSVWIAIQNWSFITV